MLLGAAGGARGALGPARALLVRRADDERAGPAQRGDELPVRGPAGRGRRRGRGRPDGPPSRRGGKGPCGDDVRRRATAREEQLVRVPAWGLEGGPGLGRAHGDPVVVQAVARQEGVGEGQHGEEEGQHVAVEAVVLPRREGARHLAQTGGAQHGAAVAPRRGLLDAGEAVGGRSWRRGGGRAADVEEDEGRQRACVLLRRLHLEEPSPSSVLEFCCDGGVVPRHSCSWHCESLCPDERKRSEAAHV